MFLITGAGEETKTKKRKDKRKKRKFEDNQSDDTLSIEREDREGRDTLPIDLEGPQKLQRTHRSSFSKLN